ncbi:addiction module antitoxin [Ectothiorhodospira haloalkaliphila]|jgi:mRNA interferase YafQ|uniref:mRNA interferase YafQ n=2 Tax=Ectothiorhodospira TaxID=1051 RepID=A0A1H7RWY4_9GAMM|nr:MULTISPECIES: type II toxin-antitoxin system YafQ family toxin [Ectothiorhodospira]AHK80254.1 addiction module antitoxin [Ectothiorhodospira haloalkaliphila]SEL64588.1 mRNA interferase YafQ [Ectothiorhodospira marina]
MRTIDRSSAFKRDYKREAKGRHRTTLDDELKPVLIALATDQALDVRYRDHDLSGDWAGYRECHIKPDLLLIYRKSDPNTLRLARLGSHSKLFG